MSSFRTDEAIVIARRESEELRELVSEELRELVSEVQEENPHVNIF